MRGTTGRTDQFIEQDPGPRGSPHAPHAPPDAGNGAASLLAPFVLTANTERSFCRFTLWHDGQLGD